MKLIVVAALALVACAYAVPVEVNKPEVTIVRSDFEQQPEGAYVYGFETSDGTQRQENGELREALDEDNKPQQVVVVKGSYSYVDPDGKTQTITYYADETGFHAEGDSIPKEPVARR